MGAPASSHRARRGEAAQELGRRHKEVEAQAVLRTLVQLSTVLVPVRRFLLLTSIVERSSQLYQMR